MPAAQPRTAQTTGTWAVQRSGISRWACAGRRRWMLPTRGLPALLVAGDDVEAGAEVLALTGEQDGAHRLRHDRRGRRRR